MFIVYDPFVNNFSFRTWRQNLAEYSQECWKYTHKIQVRHNVVHYEMFYLNKFMSVWDSTALKFNKFDNCLGTNWHTVHNIEIYKHFK